MGRMKLQSDFPGAHRAMINHETYRAEPFIPGELTPGRQHINTFKGGHPK